MTYEKLYDTLCYVIWILLDYEGHSDKWVQDCLDVSDDEFSKMLDYIKTNLGKELN